MELHSPVNSNKTTESVEQIQPSLEYPSSQGTHLQSAINPGQALTPGHIAQLQRSIGNQATIQLLRSREQQHSDSVQHLPQSSNTSNPIQRVLVGTDNKTLSADEIQDFKDKMKAGYKNEEWESKKRAMDDKHKEDKKYRPFLNKNNQVSYRDPFLKAVRKSAIEERRSNKLPDKVENKDRKEITIDPNAIELSKRVPARFTDLTSNDTIIPAIKQEYGININGVDVNKGRKVSIMQLSFDEIEALHHAKWYETGKTIEADMTVGDKETTFIFSGDGDLANSIKYLVHIKYLILNKEGVPRSGKARAAADELEGTKRMPSETEAAYDSVKKDIDYKKEEEKTSNQSIFTSKQEGNKFVSSIKHMGPWTKGDRGSGQSDVKGGQNAKNHVIDHFLKNGENKEAARKSNTTKEIQGRFEWLHIIGSSLGGENVPTNLVAGSYDQNTKMIALEHKVALWGLPSTNKDTEGSKIRPSVANPITIKGEAEVYDNSSVGKSISLEVKYGDQAVVNQTYQVDDQTVITKKQYEEEEKNINEKIEASKKTIFAEKETDTEMESPLAPLESKKGVIRKFDEMDKDKETEEDVDIDMENELDKEINMVDEVDKDEIDEVGEPKSKKLKKEDVVEDQQEEEEIMIENEDKDEQMSEQLMNV